MPFHPFGEALMMYPNILVRNEDVSILATAVYLEIPLL